MPVEGPRHAVVLPRANARLTKAIERRLEGDLETWELLVVLLAGELFGFVVVFGDYLWWDGHHRTFSGNGAFVLWAGLMCAQTGLWALALAWLLPTIGRLRAEYGEENRTEVTYSTWLILGIIALVAVGGPFANTWPNFVPHHAVKLALLTLVGALVGLVAARGIWFVHGGLKKLGAEDLRTESVQETFLSLHSDVRRCLVTLGAILGLIILATSAQRQAVLAYKADTEYGYELVLVYGFFFSILVAAVYIPTQLTLARVGNSIRDEVFPALPPTSPEWEERAAKREKLGKMLDLQEGPFGQFKASVAILTPLIGSLVGLLLK